MAGRHTVKAGVDIQYVEYRDQISFFDGEELGRYVFDGRFTGNAFADFLLGLPRFTGYILPAPDVNPFATYYAFFAQDDWRPTPSLTINFGLRYDLRPPMKDRSNQLGNFDRDYPGGRVIVSDAAGLALVPDFVRNSVPNTPFVTADEAGFPKRCAAPTRTTSVRASASPGGPPTNDRTVVRGGIGLYTVPLLGSVNYSMVATVTAAAVGLREQPGQSVRVSEHLVGRVRAGLRAGRARWTSAAPTRWTCSDPQTMQWSLTLERDLGWNIGAARQLHRIDRRSDLIWSPDLNQVPANTRGYAAVADTRPFPDWNVVTTRANDPRSRYDALGIGS